MMLRTKQEIALIKQQILDYCLNGFKKTGEISRELNVSCATINSYAYDLWRNGSFVERIPEKTATKTHTWAYKTVIPAFKELSKSPSAVEEAKWNYIHVPLFGYQPIEHKVTGRTIKADDRDGKCKEYIEHIKDADKKRRKDHKSSRVHVSGSTLHMAV